jgi:hypothetical protein
LYWSSLFRFIDYKFVFISDLSHACYTTHPCHIPWCC